MNSPVTALIWEIWQRNRRSFAWLIAILLFGWIFSRSMPDSDREVESRRDWIGVVLGLLMAGSLLCVFGIFNFTESSPGRDWSGFPYRLFVLPVSTGTLVLVPVALGLLCLEIVYSIWAGLIFTRGEIVDPWWFAGLLGSYLVFYQSVLWCLAGVRITRIILLGITGPLFILIAWLPFAEGILPVWVSKGFLGVALLAWALIAFGCAWYCVCRQRCGGGRRRNWLRVLADQAIDSLPRRRGDFKSPADAQLWLEWRRSGTLLPACLGALLVLFIGPLSWCFRADAEVSLWILAWTLAAPLILALPLGKQFSKPDFWSKDLSVPAFVAIRPLASGEMVVCKLKVAALSSILSWLLVLAFLSLWLPGWANLDSLGMIRVGFWMAYGHSVYPQYAMAALSIVAGAFFTWKFLVGGLWIGLSGRWNWFMGSAAAYCLVFLMALITVSILIHHDAAVRRWVREDPDRLLGGIEWIAAAAVVAKTWMAARFWRGVSPTRVCKYLLSWLAGTLCLLTLAVLLWADGLFDLLLIGVPDFLPLDAIRLRNLMILLVLLAIPFARLGLAPASLARNRHGRES